MSIINSGSSFWEYKEGYFIKDIKNVQNNKYFERVVANYPLDVMKDEFIPEGVITTMKELYLDDETFKSTFKMTKEDFYLLPE